MVSSKPLPKPDIKVFITELNIPLTFATIVLSALNPVCTFSISKPCSFIFAALCSNCIIAFAIALACSSPALANKNTLLRSPSLKFPNSFVKDIAASSPLIRPLLKSSITLCMLSASPGNTVINPKAASLKPTAPILAASRTATPISPPTSPPIALIPDRKL